MTNEQESSVGAQAVQRLDDVELVGIVENPRRLMENGTKLAAAFNDIVASQQLFTTIGKKNHIHVDGWSMMGVLLGVFPEVVSTERVNGLRKFKLYLVEMQSNYNNKKYKKWIPLAKLKGEEVLDEREVEEIAYRAVVKLNTLGGKTITQVETICSNREEGKEANEEYAIQSMAQTRATGKAYRMAFGWIARLAGYESTPFEEAEGVYKKEPEQPHAPIQVMDGLREKINSVETEEEYKAAIKEISKYKNQLNAADQNEIRELAKEKKAQLDSNNSNSSQNDNSNSTEVQESSATGKDQEADSGEGLASA